MGGQSLGHFHLQGPGFAKSAGEPRLRLLPDQPCAKRLGGYSDPLTAFRNLRAGTATEADIAPAYSSLEDIPGGPGNGPDRTAQ